MHDLNYLLAMAPAGDQPPSLMRSLLPMVMIFGVFYFLLIRPQQKKMKQHRTSLESIQTPIKFAGLGWMRKRRFYRLVKQSF